MALKLGTAAANVRLGSTAPKAIRRGSSHIWSAPNSIPGLHSWWDFSEAGTITLNGSNISQIADKSGNGRHMAQATAASQPARTLNAQNGLSAATFTGTQLLQSGTAADWKFLHYGTDKSLVFAVFKATGDISKNYEVLGTAVSPGGSSVGLLVAWSGGDGLLGAYTGTPFGTANWAETIPNPFFDTAHALCAISEPSAAGADRLLLARLDDRDAEDMSYQDWDNSPADANPENTLTIGRSGPGVAPFFTPFEGLICEVLIYRRSSAFTSGERSAVFDFLAAKWGLT